MTLPKGYVPSDKKADEKTKQLAADEKTKQLAADEKTKQLAADEKTISKANDTRLLNTENSYNKSGSLDDSVDMNIEYPNNSIDYALLWDEMNKAYMQTVKESTISYFRLLDFWVKNFKK